MGALEDLTTGPRSIDDALLTFQADLPVLIKDKSGQVGNQKIKYADLKQASADRCPRLLGTIVKGSEVQFHHDVYNQLLWGQF